MCLDPELGLYFLRAIAPRLDESAQLNAGEIAQNSYVVEPKAARADDANAWGISQITTPRSLASTNRISSLTSGSGSSSVCACSIAWDTLRSDRKNSR